MNKYDWKFYIDGAVHKQGTKFTDNADEVVAEVFKWYNFTSTTNDVSKRNGLQIKSKNGTNNYMIIPSWECENCDV